MSKDTLSPALQKRAEEIYRPVMRGFGAVDAVLAKSDSGERAADALAREISTMIAKKEDLR